MHSFNKPSRIVITCSKRITPFLQQEIIGLGYRISGLFQTGVEIKGTLQDCIRLNLHLTTASQVLYSLKSFTCSGPDQLYEIISGVQWENIIDRDGYFSITSNVSTHTINNSLFANVKVKDAIADRFRNKLNSRPDSGPSLDKTVINLFWKGEEAEIFIDTSGETLSKHGYRRIPGKAPMQESLASASLLATRWDLRSPFVNPMCGAGTLAIEAAMLATGRRPGLFRDNYGFMHIAGFQPEFLQVEMHKLRDQVREVPGLEIIANDLSSDAIHISRINAGAAGVAHMIRFQEGDFEETTVPPEKNGIVFFNPEYGERLGEEAQLEKTYARIGDFMKQKCGGYTGYIFTGNLELAKRIGLKAKRRTEFYNGRIDCRLLEYELYAGSRARS